MVSDSTPDPWYDRYLEALLTGEAETPASFGRRHRLSDRQVAALEGVWRLARQGSSSAGAPESGPEGLGEASAGGPGARAAPGDTEFGRAHPGRRNAGADPDAEEAERALAALSLGPDLPFERAGEYELIRPLGSGGMGTVYLAREARLGRLCAVKWIRRELAHSATAAARFEREARIVSQLDHPGIATVFGFGYEGGHPYFAMEYVEGASLAEHIARATVRGERLDPRRVVEWGRQVAEALAFAHEREVVHRDVKPSNVRIAADGRARLLDFGLARRGDSASLTLPGGFAGTPSYASPEQVRRTKVVDARTDVFSLGATLYEALTGVAPFEGETIEAVVQRVLHEDPPPPSRVGARVPRDLETVLAKALEKDPQRRYVSARALADDLAAVLALRPVSARPLGPPRRAWRLARRNPATSLALAAGLVAVLAALSWSAFERASERAAAEQEAARLVAGASEIVDAYRGGRDAYERSRRVLAEFHGRRERGELDATLEANASLAVAAVTAYEESRLGLARVPGLLSEARRLDADAPGIDASWAAYYYQRWLDVRDAREPREATHYREMIERHDPGGEWSEKVAGRARLHLTPTPEHCEVHVFRYVPIYDGAVARVVPRPIHSTETPGGEWALRPIEGAGDPRLNASDRLVSVAGHPVRGSLLVAEGPPPLARGDRLVSVDGRRVRSEADWRARVLEASARAASEESNAGGNAVAIRSESAVTAGAERVALVEPSGSVEGAATIEAASRAAETVERATSERATLRCLFVRAGGERFEVALDARAESAALARESSALDSPALDSPALDRAELDSAAPDSAVLASSTLRLVDARTIVGEGNVLVDRWRDGERATLPVEAGLETRVTAAPLELGPASFVGLTPATFESQDPGWYLAHFQAPGHEPLRVSFHIDHACELYFDPAGVELDPRLEPFGASPRGFVRVAVDALPNQDLAFWMQEREVTCAEYLAFLRSPAVRERAAEPGSLLVPIDPRVDGGGRAWPSGANGIELPRGMAGDWPVLGVSWIGASEYAAWFDAREGSGEAGGLWFGLPTEMEWRWAAFGGDSRDLPFGDDFDPRWIKSRYATAEPTPEPVLSYPVDESPFGLFDLAGSAREWCHDAEPGSGGARRAICGGSWLDRQLVDFQIRTARSAATTTRDPAVGFRLVARRRPPEEGAR